MAACTDNLQAPVAAADADAESLHRLHLAPRDSKPAARTTQTSASELQLPGPLVREHSGSHSVAVAGVTVAEFAFHWQETQRWFACKGDGL